MEVIKTETTDQDIEMTRRRENLGICTGMSLIGTKSTTLLAEDLLNLKIITLEEKGGEMADKRTRLVTEAEIMIGEIEMLPGMRIGGEIDTMKRTISMTGNLTETSHLLSELTTLDSGLSRNTSRISLILRGLR
jgi:hypothetical protein